MHFLEKLGWTMIFIGFILMMGSVGVHRTTDNAVVGEVMFTLFSFGLVSFLVGISAGCAGIISRRH